MRRQLYPAQQVSARVSSSDLPGMCVTGCDASSSEDLMRLTALPERQPERMALIQTSGEVGFVILVKKGGSINLIH